MAHLKRHVPAEFERSGLGDEANATAPAAASTKKRQLDSPGSSHRTEDSLDTLHTASVHRNGLPKSNLSSPVPQNDPEAAKDVFPFLKLPAELRMAVYRCALFRDEPLLLDLPPKDEKDDPTELTRPRKEKAKARKNTAINVKLLQTCSLVYKEARQVFYSENVFNLSIESSVATLAQLHQRSRSLIRAVTLTMPSHHDILDSFADMVRLGLRYCWGLKTFTIRLDVILPDFDILPAGHHGGIYANAFRILRWLPKGCKVILEGNINESVKRVVAEERRLLAELDEVSYFRRQHQMSGRISGSQFTPSQRELPPPPRDFRRLPAEPSEGATYITDYEEL